jgi:hypothetical protein
MDDCAMAISGPMVEHAQSAVEPPGNVTPRSSAHDGFEKLHRPTMLALPGERLGRFLCNRRKVVEDALVEHVEHRLVKHDGVTVRTVFSGLARGDTRGRKPRPRHVSINVRA